MRIRHFLALTAVLASTVSAREARAGGFYVAKYGSDLGNPMTANAYGVHYNPGAIGGIGGSEVVLDGSVAKRSASYERPQSALSPSSQPKDDPLYREGNTGRATLSNTLFTPFVGAAVKLGSTPITIGFASFVPFGGSATWDKNQKLVGNKSAPGAADGVQRWAAVSGTTISWYNTLAAAVTIPHTKLSFGVSASYVKHDVKIVRARNIDGSDDMRDSSGRLIEGRTLLEASGADVAIGIGAYGELTPTVRAGLSYLARPGFGESRLPGTLDVTVGNKPDSSPQQKIDFLQTLPDILRAGVAVRMAETAEVRVDADWQRWSAMKRQCVVSQGKSCDLRADGSVGGEATDVLIGIPRDWRDTFGVRVSGSLWADKTTEIFLGAHVDTSAVPKETLDSVYMDSLKFGGQVGVKKTVGRFALAASYNQVVYASVDNAAQSGSNKLVNPSRSPSNGGRYDQSIVFLNANASVRF